MAEGLATTIIGLGKWKLKAVKDDRSAIQKKTFTKWINTYLIKVGGSVDDLYEDLKDGNRLLTLLEILTGDRLPRERGKMRFHHLQNVDQCLSLLRRKNIKLVNIRNDSIVDGNHTLTLGLIWTIILNFEISHDTEGQAGAKANLMDWAKRATRGYSGIDVRNFTSSFKNGMAFNAIIHRFRPDIIDYENLVPEQAEENLENAFSVAEEQLGIPRLLDVEDFILDELDEKSIMTYLSAFNRMYSKVPSEEELAVKVYSDRYNADAVKVLSWIKNNIEKLERKIYKMDPEVFQKFKADLEKLRNNDMPNRKEQKDYLHDCYKNLKLAEAENMITTDITMDKIEQYWSMLESSLADKEAAVEQEDERVVVVTITTMIKDKHDLCKLRAQDELAQRIRAKAKSAAKELDQIKRMMEDLDDEDLASVISDAKRRLYNSNIEEDTRAMFSGVSALVKENHPLADPLNLEVQLISDELDEIKARLDLLHRDMEQNLQDELEKSLEKILQWIRDKEAVVREAGYGEDLPTSSQIMSDLTEHIEEINNYQSEVNRAKQLVADNPRSDVNHQGQLLDIEHEYTMLKSGCQAKEQDLREGFDFLSSVNEMIVWGEKARDNELTYDWSGYNPHVEPYERGIAKRQKKFEGALLTSRQLVKTEHPMAEIIEKQGEDLGTLWDCLKDLMTVAEIHIQNFADYDMFWKRLNNANSWIKQKRQLLDTRYNAKCLDVISSSERLQELVDLKKDIFGYEPSIVQISDMGKVVVNLAKRKNLNPGDNLDVLSPYQITGVKDKEPLIAKGDKCQFVEDVGLDRWRVKRGLDAISPYKGSGRPKSNGTNGHSSEDLCPGLIVEAPKCLFQIIPPDQECLHESRETETEYDNLKIRYDKQRSYLKHLMVKYEFFSNCDVVLTWPYDKNFEAELRGRELVVEQLKEAGKELIKGAQLHENSDSDEIEERQLSALQHWDQLCSKHKHRTSELEELTKLTDDASLDVLELDHMTKELELNPANITDADNEIESLLKQAIALQRQVCELERRAEHAGETSCLEDFEPIMTKLNKLENQLLAIQERCDNKGDAVHQIISLTKLMDAVGVALDNISGTLSAMTMYPLDVEYVNDDLRKLKLLDIKLMDLEGHVNEMLTLKLEQEDVVLNTPLETDFSEVVGKKDSVVTEIQNRWQALEEHSTPSLTTYEDTVGRGLHWLEDAEDKLVQAETVPNYKDKYELVVALQADVYLKKDLFKEIYQARDLVVHAAEGYNKLLTEFRDSNPSPSKANNSSADVIATKETKTVQLQYRRIEEDVNRLIVIYEKKYKDFERLAEELELITVWEGETTYKIEHPARVLIQLKEVSRVKQQHTEMLEEIRSKGKVINAMESDIVEVTSESADSPQSLELTEKLKIVREAYTVILKAAKTQSQDLQETMDRVEKVVYWYNCLQQYLKNSRKRLELLDPLATDVADVSKQLKLCKALTTELESKEELIEEMMKESEQLLQLANKDHLYIVPADLGDKVNSFRADWKKFCSKCKTQEKRLERTYTKLRKLEAALEKILRWQQDKEKELESAPPISSDLAIIKQQLEQIKSLRAIVDGCESHITTANELARSLINRGKTPQDSIPPLKSKLEKINEGWCRMDATITSRLYELEAALKRSQGIEKALEELKAWLEEKEMLLESKDTLTLQHDDLQESLSKYTEMKRDIHGYENVVATTAEKALLSLTPDDRDQMKERLDNLQRRYRLVRGDCENHQDKLSEVYQGVDNLRRNVSTIHNTLERSKDNYNEMGLLATNIPSLKEQLKEVIVFVNGLDSVTPDIAAVVEEGDIVSDFALLQQYPKLQREVLQLPQTLQKEHDGLHKNGSDRRKDVEERMNKLENIDELIEKFNEKLAGKKNDLEKLVQDNNLSLEDKDKGVQGFVKDHADLSSLLDKIKGQVDEVISGSEDTPFLKRRIQEADEKLNEFEKMLKTEKQGLADFSVALNKHSVDTSAILDEIEILEVECGELKPISATVSAATAQTLQNMNLIESCDVLQRKQADLREVGDELAQSLPPDLKNRLEEDRERSEERLNRLSNSLKSRMDTLDGVLPFITHLQDLEKDLLPWLEDTEHTLKTQSNKPAETQGQIKNKINKIKELQAEVESHQCDVEDTALFGESALELVSGYDNINVCPTVEVLEDHLKDVQDRYTALIIKLKEDNDDLALKQQLNLDLTRLNKATNIVEDYLNTLPEPRLNENDLKQFISDIDEKLDDIAGLEEQLSDLIKENPAAANSPDIKDLKDRLQGLKSQLKDKKVELIEKCDTLELLTADIDDILNAIKGVSPTTCKVPLSDIKSVEAHEKAQEDLTPKIASIDNKLSKLQEVYDTIAKNCNPMDAKRLETKLADLKQKCAEKEKKKEEKLAELKKTKDQLNKFNDLSDKLRKYLNGKLEDLSNADPPSNTAEKLKQQLEEHKDFTEDFQTEGPKQLKELMKLAHVLRNDLLDNGSPIDEKVKGLQKLYDDVTNAAAHRQQELEALMIEAQNVKDTLDYILPWLCEAEEGLLKQGKPGAEIDTVTLQQEKQKVDQQSVQSHADLVASLKDQSGLMEEDLDQLEEVLAKWERINDLHTEKKEELSKAFDHLLEFEKCCADLSSFIAQTENDILEASQVPLSDVQIVEDMIQKHKVIQEAIVTKSSDLELVNALGEDYKELTGQPEIIADKLEEINKRWDWLKGEEAERAEALALALGKTAAVDNQIQALTDWLIEAENWLKSCDPVGNTYDELTKQLAEHKEFHTGFDAHQEQYDDIIVMCHELMMESADPAVSEALDEKLNELGQKWDQVQKASMARQRALEEAIQICHDFQDSVNAILEWLPDAEQALDSLEPLSDDYDTITQQIQELLTLSFFMAEQNNAVEQVCTLGAIREETGPALSEEENTRYNEMKDRYKELWNKIGARQDQLNQKQEEMDADEDIANFDITEWKKRFLRWMDGNHDRIIDMFRRFDVDKNGTLDHQEFRDGIIAAGVPTPRSCFPLIIREFDRDDSGDINYREFAAALKRYEVRPTTEGEHIDYEVQRAVDRCMCRRRFNCVQVGEAKYRFGTSQKLYLVRILSTVVMVRVGGGWQPLHEFLQKYDPCRAKGRTNVDLGKVPNLTKDANGRVISPLKLLARLRPNSEAAAPSRKRSSVVSPKSSPLRKGLSNSPSSEMKRSRVNPECDTCDVEHDGTKVNYKPRGGYVSPYSCAALGLKKRSGSSNSLVSSPSSEFDSPLRRTSSKGAMGGPLRSNSRSSTLGTPQRSSSKGSITKSGSKEMNRTSSSGSRISPSPNRSTNKSRSIPSPVGRTPTRGSLVSSGSRGSISSPARTTPRPLTTSSPRPVTTPSPRPVTTPSPRPVTTPSPKPGATTPSPKPWVSVGSIKSSSIPRSSPTLSRTTSGPVSTSTPTKSNLRKPVSKTSLTKPSIPKTIKKKEEKEDAKP